MPDDAAADFPVTEAIRTILLGLEVWSLLRLRINVARALRILLDATKWEQVIKVVNIIETEGHLLVLEIN